VISSPLLSIQIDGVERRAEEIAGSEREKNKSRGAGPDLYSVQQSWKAKWKNNTTSYQKQKSDANW
jgi:hypothetical protein